MNYMFLNLIEDLYAIAVVSVYKSQVRDVVYDVINGIKEDGLNDLVKVEIEAVPVVLASADPWCLRSIPNKCADLARICGLKLPSIRFLLRPHKIAPSDVGAQKPIVLAQSWTLRYSGLYMTGRTTAFDVPKRG